MFFMEFSWFSSDLMDVDNLISASSAFSKTTLNIWKFMVHVLLKPGLENFEHNFTSLWDEYIFAVVEAMSLVLKQILLLGNHESSTVHHSLSIAASTLPEKHIGSFFLHYNNSFSHFFFLIFWKKESACW